MAAIMVAGMMPPLGIALTILLFRNYFDIEDRKSIPTIFVAGSLPPEGCNTFLEHFGMSVTSVVIGTCPQQFQER